MLLTVTLRTLGTTLPLALMQLTQNRSETEYSDQKFIRLRKKRSFKDVLLEQEDCFADCRRRDGYNPSCPAIAENNVPETSQTTVSEDLAAKADKFVTAEDGQFVLDRRAAKDQLTPEELREVSEAIATTNKQIRHGIETTETESVTWQNTITVYNSQEDQIHAEERGISGGVTKVDFSWNKATIYLSKETLATAAGGVSVAGIFIPEPIVSKVLSAVGGIGAVAIGNNIERGVIFDVNYAELGISVLVPPFGIPTWAPIHNERMQ